MYIGSYGELQIYIQSTMNKKNYKFLLLQISNLRFRNIRRVFQGKKTSSGCRLSAAEGSWGLRLWSRKKVRYKKYKKRSQTTQAAQQSDLPRLLLRKIEGEPVWKLGR